MPEQTRLATHPVSDARIARVEWARLTGRRPRKAGSNARLGEHGAAVSVPIARLTTDAGSSGFGFCHTTPEKVATLLGTRLTDLLSPERAVQDQWLAFEYPLLDLIGKQAGQPVYALVATGADVVPPFTVPCYDTSLYFDDLHLPSAEAAAALLATEAQEGYARGHRAFKIKVGRGARHLPLEEGTARDIAIVRAIRQAVGPHPALMLDANNGYNLNLARRVLGETADCGVFWLEEAFHEDAVLYRELRGWLDQQGLPVLIADGEGQASPSLMDWARERLIDVIQYDIFHPGFTRWLEIGRQLDAWGVRSAPHHYGGLYGNYASCHLASALQNFTYVEWDEATAPGLNASGYTLQEGRVSVPASPGFGLALDEAVFERAVEAGGFRHPS